jgi:predicted PurR-regulated permease PerM
MTLTLNQFLFLVITLSVVVAVTFLVTLFIQLRRTAKKGEETLVEIRSLVKNLSETSQKVSERLDDVEHTIDYLKKTASRFSEIGWFLTTRFTKPSARYWPILYPLLRFGWRQWKKRKENKNGT